MTDKISPTFSSKRDHIVRKRIIDAVDIHRRAIKLVFQTPKRSKKSIGRILYSYIIFHIFFLFFDNRFAKFMISSFMIIYSGSWSFNQVIIRYKFNNAYREVCKNIVSIIFKICYCKYIDNEGEYLLADYKNMYKYVNLLQYRILHEAKLENVSNITLAFYCVILYFSSHISFHSRTMLLFAQSL